MIHMRVSINGGVPHDFPSRKGASSLGLSRKPWVTMGSTCGCPKIHKVGKACTSRSYAQLRAAWSSDKTENDETSTSWDIQKNMIDFQKMDGLTQVKTETDSPFAVPSIGYYFLSCNLFLKFSKGRCLQCEIGKLIVDPMTSLWQQNAPRAWPLHAAASALPAWNPCANCGNSCPHCTWIVQVTWKSHRNVTKVCL